MIGPLTEIELAGQRLRASVAGSLDRAYEEIRVTTRWEGDHLVLDDVLIDTGSGVRVAGLAFDDVEMCSSLPSVRTALDDLGQLLRAAGCARRRRVPSFGDLVGGS